MKKILFFVLALTLACAGSSYADLQIDRGETRGQEGAVSKYFVARNGRVAGISADRVVVWDTTSNDGVSVTTSTTSWDTLVAGVTIDSIPGITRDATAAANLSTGNYGRVRVYGRHASVSWDSGATALPQGCTAGDLVGHHNVAGTASVFRKISQDSVTARNSTDSFGVALEACAAGNKTLDIFIDKG